MTVLNQYSYIIFSFLAAVVFIGGTALAIYRREQRIRWRLISSFTVGTIVLFAGGFLALRPGDATANSIAEVNQLITNGRPTVVQFYSNYCIGCMAIDEQFTDLVAEIKAETDVVRVDIHSDFGRALREEIKFNYSPEFVVFDPTGAEVWRGHRLPPLNLLADPQTTSTQPSEPA